MFNPVEVKKKSHKFSVVESLYPYNKPQIENLGARIDQIIDDFCEQEAKNGRIVTDSEVVGTLMFVINRVMNGECSE